MGRGAKAGSRCARRWAPDSRGGGASVGTGGGPPGGMMGASAGLPNKRLKLTGADRFKGSGVLCPSGHELTFNSTPRGGRVARSLTAVR
jgi:hypothetical protein